MKIKLLKRLKILLKDITSLYNPSGWVGLGKVSKKEKCFISNVKRLAILVSAIYILTISYQIFFL